jgi:hypothetical protein
VADYRVRPATLDDADVIVHHRLSMFTDMGVPLDTALLGGAFRAWLVNTLPAGMYRAWVVEDAEGTIVAGGGITIIPWPPGPRYLGDRLAFVYNVGVAPILDIRSGGDTNGLAEGAKDEFDRGAPPIAEG